MEIIKSVVFYIELLIRIIVDILNYLFKLAVWVGAFLMLIGVAKVLLYAWDSISIWINSLI